MKIVHTADLHIGLESHGPINPHTGLPRRQEDFLKALDQIVERAISERADLVIMAGDIYKGRDPTPTHQREFARRVLRLSQRGIPVFLLAGNHDVPNAVSRATSIDIFGELEIEGVSVGRTNQVWRLQTPSGPLLLGAHPWMQRSHLMARDEYRAKSAAEIERAMADIIAESIADLAAEVQEIQKEPEFERAPAVLAAHLHAKEARDGAERSLTVGTDPLIPIQHVALPTFDYVALGHIHAYQKLYAKPPAVYPGSIERVNFGEETEKKGFVIAEVARGNCEWEFVELEGTRRFVTIEAKALTDDPTDATLKQIERRRSEIPDAVVRVRVEMSLQNQATFDETRVRNALTDAFWVWEIYRNVERPARMRYAGVSVEEKSPLELLDDYFADRQVPDDERQRLRVYAERLMARGAVA
jgi:exonuclease SbcD